jgi:hypothetical protein
MKKITYKITINNWEKYNGKIKKSYKCILLSYSFLRDAKIRQVSPVTRLLYLSCLLVAGESARSQIEVSHESLVFESGVKSESLQSQLSQLQSLQLLTYEILTPLKNRIEKNRIERKGIEAVDKKSTEPKDSSPSFFKEKKYEGAEKIFIIWQNLKNKLPTALTLSEKRKVAAQARWNEKPEVEYWEEVVKKLANSDFCNGKNERTWKADFDFLIKPDTHIRVSEGKYDNKKKSQSIVEAL